MKAIVILFDTLCRRFLPAYGNERIRTPNMVRLAEKSVVFDNHWMGFSALYARPTGYADRQIQFSGTGMGRHGTI